MSQYLYTVSTLVRYLKDSLDQDINLRTILLQGEISNFTNHRSGHWYFTLKDAKARISCVMFASHACRCSFLPQEGMQVIVKASLSVYEAQGSVQLYVSSIQMDGIGDLYLRYEQLKRKLMQEGIFDSAHKKPLPLYPMHIVLISAKEGAAIHDMRQTLKRRWPLAKVTFLPSLVQGKEAAAQLIENVKKADALCPDVILIGRGGGSIEDLWCFNDEALARCVYACESVIVSGVGHESDTTLIDYVADARAATPTAAAELVTPDQYEVAQLLQLQRQRLYQAVNAHLMQAKRRHAHLCNHRYIQQPSLYVQEATMRLSMLSRQLEQGSVLLHTKRAQLEHQRQTLILLAQAFIKRTDGETMQIRRSLHQGIKKNLEHQQKNFLKQAALLDAYSPLKILQRGYGVLYAQEHVIKSIREVAPHDTVKIRMQDGILHADVKQKEEL